MHLSQPKSTLVYRIISITIIFSIQAQFLFCQSTDTYSLMEIKEDFALAKSAFYELHPRPFQWHSKESFDEMWSIAEKTLKEGMTSDEFSQTLYPIFQKLGCGHSRVYGSKKIAKAKAKKYKKGAVRKQIPFNIKSIAGNTYIKNYFLKDSLILKADQIISINQESLDDIKNDLELFISSDGINTTHYQKSIDKNFVPYFHRSRGYSEKYEVTIIDSSGVEKTIELKPNLVSKQISKDKRKAKKKSTGTVNNTKPKKYNTLLKKGNYRFLRSKKDSSVAIIKIPSFAGSDGKKIYKKAFKLIENDETIKNLVIDLRGNGGGDASESWFLTSALNQEKFQTDLARSKNINDKFKDHLSTSRLLLFLSRIKISTLGKSSKSEDQLKTSVHFKPNKKHCYNGKLFVLIDGYSFSASSVVSSYLKSSKRAIFIGEETGGGMYGTNAMHSPYIVLPNTTVRIRFGLWALDQIVEGGIPGRGVFPDFETNNTYEDFKNDVDVEM